MTPIGDLARNALLQSQTKALRTMVQAKSDELATGRTHDLRSHLGGGTGQMHAIQSDLSLLEAYQTNIKETRSLLEAQQRGLDNVRGHVADVVEAALTVQGSNSAPVALKRQVEQSFESITGQLLASIGGRAVYGARPISGSSMDLLSQIASAVDEDPNRPRSEVAQEAVLRFIDAGGGAADSSPSDIPVSPHQTIRAVHSESLQSIAGSLASLGLIIMENPEDTSTRLQEIASEFLHHEGNIVSAQVEIGQRENLLDVSQTRNASEQTALRTLRNELTAADPFEAATQLQTATLRLETLLAATARISKLSLTSYL